MEPVLTTPVDVREDARLNAAQAFEGYVRRMVRTPWTTLPDPVRQRAAMVVADNVAAAFSALAEPEVARAAGLARRSVPAGGPAILLWPGGPRVSVPVAAAQNALAMGWNELDEGYRLAVCHGGLYCLPTLMAVAGQRQSSAEELLRALVLAYDVVARIASVWRPGTMRIHPHALLAPVGAAAGAAILARLPEEIVVRAVAGACALGMAGPFNQATEGILIRNAWAAHAASMGLMAAAHAQAGIAGCARTPYDVYAATLGMETDVTGFDDDGQWAVAHGYQKLHACCQYAHSAIEAVQSILARQPGLLGGTAVTAVHVQAHPLARTLTNQTPRTTLAAKFSLPHAVAAALVHGHGGAAAFDTASLHDARIARLRAMVRITPFPEPRTWPQDRPARVTLGTPDGAMAHTCWSARGGPDQPFAQAEIWSKVESACAVQAPHAPATLRALAGQVLAGAGGAGAGLTLQSTWNDWMCALTRPTPLNPRA